MGHSEEFSILERKNFEKVTFNRRPQWSNCFSTEGSKQKE